MKVKEKAEQLIHYSIKLHGVKDAKEEVLKVVDQVRILAPLDQKKYWNEVETIIKKTMI
jgi:hypothetical protein